jgi:hypothetical protein
MSYKKQELFILQEHLNSSPVLSVFFWGLEQEELEDTRGVIRIRESKKDRHHNGQKKKDKRTNNDLQNTTHKTNVRLTRTALKPGLTQVLRKSEHFLLH